MRSITFCRFFVSRIADLSLLREVVPSKTESDRELSILQAPIYPALPRTTPIQDKGDQEASLDIANS